MDKTQMLSSVKQYLSCFGKPDEKILNAMSVIDRKKFIHSEQAYQDNAIPIEKNQTTSQPSTIARMLSLLELNKQDKVLEIGTGSGWNSSLLAYLSKQVLSLEIYDKLIKKAKQNIKSFNMNNLKIQKKDFRQIKEKFNKIIFTAGISEEQEQIIENFALSNLKESGILLCPYQSGPLIIIRKNNNKIEKHYTNDKYVFVALIL